MASVLNIMPPIIPPTAENPVTSDVAMLTKLISEQQKKYPRTITVHIFIYLRNINVSPNSTQKLSKPTSSNSFILLTFNFK